MINSTTILNTANHNRTKQCNKINQILQLKDLKFSSFTSKPQAKHFINPFQYYTKTQEFGRIPKEDFIKDINNQLEKFQTLMSKNNDFIEKAKKLTQEQEAQFKQILEKTIKPSQLYNKVQEIGRTQKEEFVKNMNFQLGQIRKLVNDQSSSIVNSTNLTLEQKSQLNDLLSAKSPHQFYNKVQYIGRVQTEGFVKEINEQIGTIQSAMGYANNFYEHAKKITPEQEAQLKKLWTQVEKKYTNESLPNNINDFKKMVIPDALKLYGIVTNSYSHYYMSYLTFLM